MAEQSINISSGLSEQPSEKPYRFSTLDELKKALQDNGWLTNKIDGLFFSDSTLLKEFDERIITLAQLKKFAEKLEKASSRYEQENIIRQIQLVDLKNEIGETIVFNTLADLKRALEDRKIDYPGNYLEQKRGTFVSEFGSSRILKMVDYEKMINDLIANKDTPERERGEIIRAAFSRPAQQNWNNPDAAAVVAGPSVQDNNPVIPAIIVTDRKPEIDTTQIVSESGSIIKFDLRKSEQYALRELRKTGRTIKDLKTALVLKMDIPLEINDQFDQATLNAVVAFQKTIPHPVYGDRGIDGLVGSRETIPALFGIVSAPTSTPAHSAPVVIKPNSVANTTPAVKPTEANEDMLSIRKKLDTAYADFAMYASKIDVWFGAVRNTKEDIQKQQTELNKKLKTIIDLCDIYAKNPNNTIRDVVAVHRLNLAYYLTNDLEGVGNSLNKNVIRSQNLVIAVLNQNKQRISPIPEGKQAIYDTLDSVKNTPLGDTIAQALEKNPGKDLFEILSNPTIKGGWESAYAKVFEKYLTSIDASIDTLEKDTTLTIQQKKAFIHLKDIRGKNAWYDLKTEHTTAMWQGVKVGSAIIAGAAATYFSAGTLGPWAAAGVGAVVATGGMSLARGYWDGTETLIDGGINLLSFGGGALVVRLGQAARATQVVGTMGKVGAGITMAGIDGAGNISIGIIGDNVRAHLHGEDINNWDSLKMNAIPWAIFAIALNARGIKVPTKILSDAKSIEQSVARTEAMVHLGQSPKAELENIAAKGKTLEEFGKTHTNNAANIAAPDVVPPKETTTKKVPTSTETTVSPESSEVAPTHNQVAIPHNIDYNQLDSIVDKEFKNLKQGGPITIGEYSIIKQADKKVRVTRGKEIDFITTEKDAMQRVKNGLRETSDDAKKIIDSSLKNAIKDWPEGKTKNLEFEGNTYSLKKGTGESDVILTDSRGNVVKGDQAEVIYQANAKAILSQKMRSILQEHGHEKAFTKIGPDTFAFKGWGEWNAARAWYNPIKVPSYLAQKISSITLNELMEPVRVAGAMKDALTTPGSILGVTSNVAKAIVLKDINKSWGVRSIGGAAAGFAIPATLAFGYSFMHTDAEGNHLTTMNSDDLWIQNFSLYYGGLFWGTLASHMLSGTPPMTWEYK